MVTRPSAGEVYSAYCPTRRTLELIADKWTPLIICVLLEGAARYSELQRRCDGISRKVLTQTLRRLQRDGIILRVVYPAVPPHTEYSLTELGETLIDPLMGLWNWGEKYLPQIDAARAAAAAAAAEREAREAKVLETVP
jgi:DNA-binding HxlR family transcriptional regulator